ncbi:hypothetical protein BDW59DRAFT_141156 [Aspergillus cavernicola]|uniref:Uncharacterized protein n=1 Tax=Aspergillus cavernicola TaxID=176166 RepID=A0ABR4ITI0_9EURO
MDGRKGMVDDRGQGTGSASGFAQRGKGKRSMRGKGKFETKSDSGTAQMRSAKQPSFSSEDRVEDQLLQTPSHGVVSSEVLWRQEYVFMLCPYTGNSAVDWTSLRLALQAVDHWALNTGSGEDSGTFAAVTGWKGTERGVAVGTFGAVCAVSLQRGEPKK